MSFDPYGQWFRLADSDRPFNHYVLLGLPMFEADVGKIQNAALNRLVVLRKHQAGKHADLTQQLMNEVASARVCLCDPQRKAQYDLDLQIAKDRNMLAHAVQIQRSIWPIAAVCVLLAAGSAVAVKAFLDMAAGSSPGAIAPSLSDAKTPSESNSTLTPAAAVETSILASKEKPTEGTGASKTTGQPMMPTVPVVAKGFDKTQTGKSPEQQASQSQTPPNDGFQPTMRFDAPKSADAGQALPDSDLPKTVGPFLGPGDEDGPALVGTSDKWIVYLGGKSAGELMWARRKEATLPFLEIGTWSGMPIGKAYRGFATSRDSLECFFSTADKLELQFAERTSFAGGWSKPVPLVGEAGPVVGSWPAVANNGNDLYFTQSSQDGPVIASVRRQARGKPFGAPKLLGFPARFSRPAVTDDGQMLYCQGPTAGGGTRIYRSKLRANGTWSTPEAIQALRGFANDRPANDRSPAITFDGGQLYFASDREGGAGGFDLWTVSTRRFPPMPIESKAPTKLKEPDASEDSKQPPMRKPPVEMAESGRNGKKTVKPGKQPKAKTVAAPAGGGPAFADWLMLGPVALEQSPRTLTDFQNAGGQSFLRVFPKLGDKSLQFDDLEWRRGPAPTKKGVYFLGAWVRNAKAAEVRLVVTQAPGGGLAWVDQSANELSWRINDVDTPLDKGVRTSEPFRLSPGRHRVVVTLVVADPAKILTLKFLQKDSDEPADLVSGF